MPHPLELPPLAPEPPPLPLWADDVDEGAVLALPVFPDVPLAVALELPVSPDAAQPREVAVALPVSPDVDVAVASPLLPL